MELSEGSGWVVLPPLLGVFWTACRKWDTRIRPQIHLIPKPTQHFLAPGCTRYSLGSSVFVCPKLSSSCGLVSTDAFPLQYLYVPQSAPSPEWTSEQPRWGHSPAVICWCCFSGTQSRDSWAVQPRKEKCAPHDAASFCVSGRQPLLSCHLLPCSLPLGPVSPSFTQSQPELSLKGPNRTWWNKGVRVASFSVGVLLVQMGEPWCGKGSWATSLSLDSHGFTETLAQSHQRENLQPRQGVRSRGEMC